MLFALVIVWEEPSLICPPPLLIKTELEVWQFFEDTCTPRHRPFLVIGELGDRWAGGLCRIVSATTQAGRSLPATNPYSLQTILNVYQKSFAFCWIAWDHTSG